MRFEVPATMKKSMLVFWVITPCGVELQADTNILEVHTVSIFIPEYGVSICVL
jgi:hypothetical protein